MEILWSGPCAVTRLKADLGGAILGSCCYACCMGTVAGARFNGVRRSKTSHPPIAIIARVVPPEPGTMYSSPSEIFVLNIDTGIWWTDSVRGSWSMQGIFSLQTKKRGFELEHNKHSPSP